MKQLKKQSKIKAEDEGPLESVEEMMKEFNDKEESKGEKGVNKNVRKKTS